LIHDPSIPEGTGLPRPFADYIKSLDGNRQRVGGTAEGGFDSAISNRAAQRRGEDIGKPKLAFGAVSWLMPSSFGDTAYILAKPSLASIFSIKHHRVSADWKRFAPTKAVNQSQLILTQWARARLIKMKLPAIKRIHLSIAIGMSS
jgi:hypothetical protein